MADNTSLNKFMDLSADAVEVDRSKKLRVGIVGTGWIAGTHMKQYMQMEDVEVVAAAELIDGKAEKFFADLGVEGVHCYKSDIEMYEKENLDAVSICTYNKTHAECTINALNAGVNVLLEKPMCVTTEEAVEIMRAEKKSGKILSIGFQPRFDDDMKLLKEVVQSGVLGKIYYIQTGGGRRTGIPFPFGTTFIDPNTGVIGAMGDIGCYSLDMVLNAIGYPKPLTVTGYTSDFFGKNPNYSGYLKKGVSEYSKIFGVDDFAAAFVRLEGDIILDFRISWAMHLDTPGDTIILGTEGGLRIPSTECWNGSIGGDMTLYHTVGSETVETKIKRRNPGANPNSGAECFYYKVRSFLDAIHTNGEPPISSKEIIYNQAIIDHIIKSSKLGKEVEVVIPEI
ncbi:MAG: Gfo/Idh/MocA family oxidoreductase [Clostridia bacterium]|nr:Gfo/Idh/MocA family oxidoreductase [Clostridia bacterium]